MVTETPWCDPSPWMLLRWWKLLCIHIANCNSFSHGRALIFQLLLGSIIRVSPRKALSCVRGKSTCKNMSASIFPSQPVQSIPLHQLHTLPSTFTKYLAPHPSTQLHHIPHSNSHFQHVSIDTSAFGFGSELRCLESHPKTRALPKRHHWLATGQLSREPGTESVHWWM